jgi:hypothetical protein
MEWLNLEGIGNKKSLSKNGLATTSATRLGTFSSFFDFGYLFEN